MARLIPAVAIMATASLAFAEATVPTADRRGAKDSPLLKRYEGSLIVASEEKGFAEFTLPLSRLEPAPRRTDGRHNRYHEPKDKRVLDGRYTRLVYLVPENRSPLEVLQNYQSEIKGKRGRILFECKAAECGGDPRKSSVGGGGEISLAMYLYPSERITEKSGSTGYCAVAAHRIADQRYAAAEMPDSGAHVSVLAYTVVASGQHDPCRTLNARTIAVVDIVEAKAREQKMVTVQAGEMARAISSEGRVALYGIYFDFNKDEIKPESDPTLEQIARLLKDAPQLKLLVVGHTDNVGTLAFNTELSQRRAAAVVNALVTRFGIGRDRLTSVGVSFASPVASNKSEEGRAKNRRVELVES